MLILPSDTATYQINFKEALGSALKSTLEADQSLTLIAQAAFDDYDLSSSLEELLEDLGPNRVVHLDQCGRVSGRTIFLSVDSDEFNSLFAGWERVLPGIAKPFLWRVPFIEASTPAIPDNYRVFAPATTQDAYSLSISAVLENVPTVVLEHRNLYDVEGYVNLDLRESLEHGCVRRVGGDLTFFASSWHIVEALQAAEILATAKINVEVVDLRFIRPLDLGMINESLQKTKFGIVFDHMPVTNSLREQFQSLARAETLAFTSEQSDKVGAKRALSLAERLLGKAPVSVDDIQFYGHGRKFCGPF